MRCVAAGLLLAAAAYGASVSGTVYLQESDTVRPLAGVRITVHQAEGGTVLGSTTTDAQGRYQIESLPRTRVQVSAARPGFFAHARRGGEPAVVVDLDAAADFAGADFEAQPGGVITGHITDAHGDPVQEVQIHLYRVTDFGGRHRQAEQTMGSDDRGQYRAFGLEPGRYLLEVATQPSDWLRDRRSPVYYPGTSDAARATEIEVRAGVEVTGIDITLRPEPVFQVSGRIVDVQMGPLQHLILRLTSTEQVSYSFAGQDGTFTFPRLPRGSYILTATGPQGIITSEPLELSADVKNLTVRPTEPGQITGRVAFSGPGAKPAEIRLRARAAWQNPLETVARAPDYQFRFADIWAGPLVVEIASPSDAYLSQVKLGSKEVPARLDVPPGGITGLELTVGFGVARVTGSIKARRGGPLPQARVALARPGTNPVEFRTAIADQNGRFVLSDVRPGEYLLGAWASVAVEQLYGPEIWGHDAVKRLTVEPRAQVELDLTAIP
jgi:5-hydroxyisourate hydrolase-like protein (transthyretin family)